MKEGSRRFAIGTGLEIEVAGPAAAAASPWAQISVSSKADAGAASTDAALAVRLSAATLRTLLDNSPMAEALLANASAEDCVSLRIANAALVRRVAGQLWQVAYEDTALSLFLRGKVIELLIEAMSTPRQGKNDVLAVSVRDLLLADPAHPPSAAELSARLGVSPRRLGAEFKDAFGMTIPEWLSDWRLCRGCDLIAGGTLSIAEIAASVGYAHLSTFTAAFTKRFGAPPSHFRPDWPGEKAEALEHVKLGAPPTHSWRT